MIPSRAETVLPAGRSLPVTGRVGSAGGVAKAVRWTRGARRKGATPGRRSAGGAGSFA